MQGDQSLQAPEAPVVPFREQAAGVEVDPVSLVPRHDAHTFESNVPNLFIAGGQVAGRRTGSVFIENGRFHGQQIAGVLAERFGVVA